MGKEPAQGAEYLFCHAGWGITMNYIGRTDLK